MNSIEKMDEFQHILDFIRANPGCSRGNVHRGGMMERDDDDYLDAQLAEMNVDLQRMTLDALDNCHKAGGRFDDLYFLAAQLGVGEAFRKTHVRA